MSAPRQRPAPQPASPGHRPVEPGPLVRVIGVNPYRLGWVGVELRAGRFSRALIASRLYDIVADASGVALIGINVPLGALPGSYRAADILVAGHLGPRRQSVFRVPPAPVWQTGEFAAASRLCRQLTGEPLGKQAWQARDRFQQANTLWERHPGLLVEAHPELSFRTMAGTPLEDAKTSWAGHAHRRDLLARHGITLPDRLGPADQAAPDDLLDAAAIAWTAHRHATTGTTSYPDPPEVTGDGRQLAIHA